MDDLHRRNPIFLADYGPPTAVQARLTGTNQTGRKVILGNPISYVVEPGRYYPFLSMRGHTDPVTQDLGERLQMGAVMGADLPSNQEPKHVTSGFFRSLAFPSTRGAVQRSPRPDLANTTLRGTGPEGLPLPDAPDHPGFFTGIPVEPGLEGI